MKIEDTNEEKSWNIIKFQRNKALKTFQLWSNGSPLIHMTLQRKL